MGGEGIDEDAGRNSRRYINEIINSEGVLGNMFLVLCLLYLSSSCSILVSAVAAVYVMYGLYRYESALDPWRLLGWRRE